MDITIFFPLEEKICGKELSWNVFLNDIVQQEPCIFSPTFGCSCGDFYNTYIDYNTTSSIQDWSVNGTKYNYNSTTKELTIYGTAYDTNNFYITINDEDTANDISSSNSINPITVNPIYDNYYKTTCFDSSDISTACPKEQAPTCWTIYYVYNGQTIKTFGNCSGPCTNN